jgi:uncharacterized protein (DUF433 family)
MGGRACIRGMRIPVSVIVGQIAHGAEVKEILEGYPDLEPDDVQQAVEYAAWLPQEEVLPVEPSPTCVQVPTAGPEEAAARSGNLPR